jgi:hypothetical protein
LFFARLLCPRRVACSETAKIVPLRRYIRRFAPEMALPGRYFAATCSAPCLRCSKTHSDVTALQTQSFAKSGRGAAGRARTSFARVEVGFTGSSRSRAPACGNARS